MIMEKLVRTPTMVGLHEYSLVVRPTGNVAQVLETVVQSVYWQSKENTERHITLASFLGHDQMEDTIVRYMQRIFMQQHSFTLALNNYGGIPPHTVHVRIQDPGPLKRLAGELQVISNYISSCSCPPLKLMTNPTLPLFQQLTESVYRDVMMNYSQQTFHETFEVNELVLLKKNNAYDNSKAVHVFRLQPAVQSFDTLYN
jgi:hypothetical protein